MMGVRYVAQRFQHVVRDVFGRAEFSRLSRLRRENDWPADEQRLVSSFLRTFEPDRPEEPSLFMVPNT